MIKVPNKLNIEIHSGLTRDLLGIDFKINMNSLKQDLEEIKNPVKSEGRKDD